MSLTRPFCYLVWLLSLVIAKHVLAEEPGFKEQLMTVCHRQQTTEELLYSFEHSSLIQCAAQCAIDVACKSANLCLSGKGKVCTLSSSFPMTECENNTSNDDCQYLITKTPCLHGGTLSTDRYCTCTKPHTGRFCERVYEDCSKYGRRGIKENWIQLGDNPPFLVTCNNGFIHIMKFIPANIHPDHFPLNKTFEEYKSLFNTDGFSNGGLESIHIATSIAKYTLTVITSYYSKEVNQHTFSSYFNFTLGSESERYRLDYTNSQFESDMFADMKGRPFSAIGNDPEGCAQMYNVAWWYTADCKPPMIYNANGKISVRNSRDADGLEFYLQFKGLK